MALFAGWQDLTGFCDPTTAKPCDFSALVELVNRGITDLVIVSTLVVLVAAVISGFKLIASQGNPSAMTETKRMFGKIVTGYAVILLAWLLVYTLASTLLKPEFFYFLQK